MKGTLSMAQIALYGNVQMKRQYCSRCKRWALVIDNELQCCEGLSDSPVDSVQRMTNPRCKRNELSAKDKRSILETQGNRCFYCSQPFGEMVWYKRRLVTLTAKYDHVSPFAYDQNNDKANMVAACQLCNGWKSDKIFRTIEEVRNYVRQKFYKKTKGHIQEEVSISWV